MCGAPCSRTSSSLVDRPCSKASPLSRLAPCSATVLLKSARVNIALPFIQRANECSCCNRSAADCFFNRLWRSPAARDKQAHAEAGQNPNLGAPGSHVSSLLQFIQPLLVSLLISDLKLHLQRSCPVAANLQLTQCLSCAVCRRGWEARFSPRSRHSKKCNSATCNAR